MLDQVRTTTCSRNQHIEGGKGGELIYVRMNVNYDRTVSKGGLPKATSVLARVKLVGQTAVTSWNSLSSTKNLVCVLGDGYCWLLHEDFEGNSTISERGAARLCLWLYLLSHFLCLLQLVISELCHCSDMAPCTLCLKCNLLKYLSIEFSVTTLC